MEAISSVVFSLRVVTDERTVEKTGTSFRELADALDDLYDESLCPFPADMEEDDPDWWDYNDELEEVLGPDEPEEDLHRFSPPEHEEI